MKSFAFVWDFGLNSFEPSEASARGGVDPYEEVSKGVGAALCRRLSAGGHQKKQDAHSHRRIALSNSLSICLCFYPAVVLELDLPAGGCNGALAEQLLSCVKRSPLVAQPGTWRKANVHLNGQQRIYSFAPTWIANPFPKSNRHLD